MGKIQDKQAFNEWERYRKALNSSTNIDHQESYVDQQKRIKQLEANVEQWFEYYFPSYYSSSPAQFHVAASKRLLSNLNWFEVRAWSRELAKSTRAMMEILFLVLTKKKRNVLLVSNSEDNAIRLMEPYRANLDSNQRILNDYGKQAGARWSESEFKTRNGVSFRALGAGQSPRGTRNESVRPDTIVIDDIDTDQDCRNPEIIRKRMVWIEGALIPTSSISGHLTVLVCGNIIAEYCCLTELMNHANKVDKVNIRTNGVSSWPSKNSEQDVDRALARISYSLAQQEYFNNPITEGRVFKELNWNKVPPLKTMEQLIVYADPSPSNKEVKNNSYKVVALLGRKAGVTYVIKVFCDQTNNSQFVQWFFDMYELTKVSGVIVYFYIENNSLQDPFYEQVFLPLFKEQSKHAGYYIPIRPDNRKKPDKFTRIEGTLEPANRLGYLVFNVSEKSNPGMLTCAGQFAVVSPSYKGAIDAPDCVEGGYYILDENLTKRKGAYRVQQRSSRKF